MGAKHSFRSPAGGGCPFLYAPWLLPGCSPAAPRLLLSSSIDANFQTIGAKKGQKLDFICLLWCFVGNLGDKKGQNPNIFLKCRGKEGARRCVPCLTFGVPTWCSWCRVQGLQVSCGVCSLPFVRFVALLWCVACKCGSISRFKGVFSGV